MEFNENELTGFRFNLTTEIQNLMIDMIVEKQLLEEGNLEAEKKKVIEKDMLELRKRFILELRRSNKEKIKEFLKLLDK